MTTRSAYAHRASGILDALQVILLCGIAVISVVSAPRQMLFQATTAPNVPVEFLIVALSLPDYCVIGLLALLALRLLIDGAYRERLSDTLSLISARFGGAWWVALALWMAAGTLWAGMPVLARFSAVHFVGALAAAFIMADLVRAGHGRSMIWALLVGALAQTLLAVLQVLNNNPLGLYALGEIPRFWYAPANFYRAPGLSSHPNYLGGYLMLALFACALLAIQRRREGRSLMLPALIGLACGVGLVATLSRSALLSTAIGFAPLVILLILALRGRVRLAAGMALIIVAVAAGVWGWIVLGGDVQTRILAPREFFFADSWEVIQRSPVLGAGAGNLMMEILRLRGESVSELLPVHNVYLFVWAELGIPGLALFIAGCGAIVFQMRRRMGIEALIWGCAFLAVCSVMIFDNYFWAVHPFRVLLFWVIGLWWGYAARAVDRDAATQTSAIPSSALIADPDSSAL
jgi:O-antigen ligase